MVRQIGLLEGPYGLALTVPTLAVNVRRLHDSGKSGWNLLFSAIPLVVSSILLEFRTPASKS